MVVVIGLMVCVFGVNTTQAVMDANNIFDVNIVQSLYLVMDEPNDFNTMAFSSDDKVTGSVFPDPCTGEHEYWLAYLSDSNSGPFISVALRRKSDLAAPNEVDPQKFSLKVDISRPGFTPAGQRFAGKKKLSLECGTDNALITEGLSWNIYNAAGVISGRCAWVKVYISTDYGASFDYMGLYSNVEQVDKEYLEDHLPNSHDYGFLYKMTEYAGEVQKTREAETNPFEFSWYPFDHPAIPEDPTPGDWLTQTPQRVDMDQLIKFAAVENFVANADGFVNKGGNYWYYDWATHPSDPCIMDPNYKEPRLYFPWDMDTTMKDSDFDMSITHAQGGHFMEGLILEQDESGTPYGYDVYQAEYYSTYRNLLDNSLTVADINALIDKIETAISADVALEPFPEDTAVTEDFGDIRTFIQDRWDYIDGLLDAMAPLPGTVLLDDGFEGTTWDANWGSPAAWLNDTGTYHSGAASAGADQTNFGDFTCNSLDTSDASAIYIRFWLMKDNDIDAGDLLLYYYDGTSYNLITDLDTAGADGTWFVYTDTITDSQYFDPNFQIRFNATPDDKKEFAWVDDVEITKTVPVVQHTLTSSSTAGGSVTNPGEGSYPYDHGIDANIAATADPNYEFDEWTGSGVTAGKVADPCSAITTILMDADYTIVANFESLAPPQRTLTTSSSAGGSVTNPGEGAYPYDHGIDANIAATADPSYNFVNWTGSGVTAGKVADPCSAITTILMDADYAVQANFVLSGIPPVITSTPVTDANVNQAYSYDVDATGIPDPTYSLNTSPAGMTINSTTGVIDWTPDAAQLGLNPVEVQANNSEGSDTQNFSINVLLVDNFDDNKRSAMWRLSIEDYGKAHVVEEANQLNVIAASQMDLVSPCVGHWKMNDNDAQTQVDDSSGNDNHGTAQQITSVLHTDSNNPPYLNGALTFNGTSDYIDVGEVIGTGAYTKAAWVKRAAGQFVNNIISADTFSHAFFAPKDISFRLAAGHNGSWLLVQDSVPLAVDTWYFVAVTFDPNVESGKMVLYKNGIEVDEANSVPTQLGTSTTTYIGRFESGYYFGGEMDNAMVFKRALTTEEIEVLYNEGNGRETMPGSLFTSDYIANGWSFDANEDFTMEVDYHYSSLSSRDSWVGIAVENDDSYVAISAGSHNNEPYFYYESIVDANTGFEQTARDANDGTLYISYDADSNSLYLSHVGYGIVNADVELKVQWTSAVKVAVGGASAGVALGLDNACLDNFKVTTATLLDWPPATDLDSNGFIGWGDVKIISDYWLDVNPGDINEDGIVNFKDFAEFGLAW